MKKIILIILFIPFLNHAQLISVDITNVIDSEQVRLKRIVNSIREGLVENLILKINMDYPPDYENLKIQSISLSKKIKSKNLISSESKSISDENPNYWITRNYYKVKKNKNKLIYQIYLEIDRLHDNYRILNIDLREGKRIIAFD